MKIIKYGLIFILMTVCQPAASGERPLTTRQWLEDLEFVVTKLKAKHPNPYYKITQPQFDSIVAESRSEITHSTSDTECYLAIRKIIASIEDGHTQLLENGVFNLLDLRFPFRVDELTDGVYITLIGKDHKGFLGSRLITINGKPIQKVLETIDKVVNNDNSFGRRYWALNGIPFARILHGLKIIDNTKYITMDLTTRTGKPTQLTLRSAADDTPIEYGWSNRLLVGPTRGEYAGPSDIPGVQTPLCFKNQGDQIKFYWFEHLVDKQTIYFQFNQVANQPGSDETFAQFSARMWDYIDQNAVNIRKLVIDLRQNNGGNGLMILPFLNQIIKRDHINKKGSLFVISGNRTHSAASMFLYELAVHTHAIFVGEPDACGADLFSDNRPAGNLPNSRFPLWIASLQFTRRFPVNNNEFIMPHFPAPFSSRDYFNGIDPAMDLILNGDVRSVADYAADEGAESALTYYQQLKEKYKHIKWWTALDPGILEGTINRKAYGLLAEGSLKNAFQVFMLNTQLFPDSSNVWDSLGECCYNMKKYELSLQYYKKSIELNPDNKNGKQMIERIKNEQKK